MDGILVERNAGERDHSRWQTKPADRVLQQPHFLVVEIWSPDDKPGELQAKIGDYRGLGIPYVLVVYPDEPRFVLYTKDAERELHDGILRTENPAIEIPLLEIHHSIPGRNPS